MPFPLAVLVSQSSFVVLASFKHSCRVDLLCLLIPALSRHPSPYLYAPARQGELRQDLTMILMAVPSLMLFQLHTNCLFAHASSTLTVCKMLLFLFLLTQFLPRGLPGWKVSAKVSVMSKWLKFSRGKGPCISGDLGLLIFESCFLPSCCTKQPQLHQATLNRERKCHLELGILILSL